jgi:endonuclease YncB( thermonuclease family)
MINIVGGGEAAGNQASRAPTAPSAPAAPAPLPAPVPVPAPVVLAALTVTHVADGDTVTLSDGREVRILGIDAPDSVKPNAPVDCHGHEAASFARSRLLGKSVTVTTDPSQDTTDRYGRTLAYLTLSDGRDFSVMAAEAGAARSYVYAGKPVAKHSQIRKAERPNSRHGRPTLACGRAVTPPQLNPRRRARRMLRVLRRRPGRLRTATLPAPPGPRPCIAENRAMRPSSTATATVSAASGARPPA